MTEDKSKNTNNEQNEPWDFIKILLSMPVLTTLLAVKTVAVIHSVFVNFSTAITRKCHQYIDYLLHATISKETKDQQEKEEQEGSSIFNWLWPSGTSQDPEKQNKNKVLNNVRTYASQNTWESAEDIAKNITNIITSAVERAVLGHEVPSAPKKDEQSPWHAPLTQFIPETITSLFDSSHNHHNTI